jgi:hypothetical protein
MYRNFGERQCLATPPFLTWRWRRNFYATLLPTYHSIRCHNPEDENMNLNGHENQKSLLLIWNTAVCSEYEYKFVYAVVGADPWMRSQWNACRLSPNMCFLHAAFTREGQEENKGKLNIQISPRTHLLYDLNIHWCMIWENGVGNCVQAL